MVAGTQTPDNFLLLVSRLNLYDPLSVNPHPDKNTKYENTKTLFSRLNLYDPLSFNLHHDRPKIQMTKCTDVKLKMLQSSVHNTYSGKEMKE